MENEELTQEEKELSSEIGKHLMQPENYGELEDANCTGVAVDHGGKSYVIMYIKRDENTILDVMFGSTASQDITTLGSIFTEMIKGDSLENIEQTIAGLEADIKTIENPTSQDEANMIILAYRAAMRHYERKQEGIEEEQFEMSLVKACPTDLSACSMLDHENK